jgi:exosortase A
MLGAGGWAFRHAAAGAVRVWYESPTFNHGFLIIPVVAYLLWERRGAIRGLAPEPALWALPFIAAASIAWFAAYAVGILEGQQFAAIAVLELSLLAILGRRIYTALLFPLLYLVFLVPTGEFLIPYLQDFTAKFVVAGLRLTGVPVFSDGVFISIPNGDFHVAEACAGLRFLIATIAFGFLFAEFTYRSWLRRAAFVALCFVVPIIANGFRAYGIVMIAHLSNNRLAVGVDHIVYGWLFFSMVTVALMAIGLLFRDRGPWREPSGAAFARSQPASPQRIALAAGLVMMLTLIAPAYASLVEAVPAAPGGALAAPTAKPPWTALAGAGDWHPSFPKADERLLQTYGDGRQKVHLFVAYYRTQSEGKELIHSGNEVADGRTWSISDHGSASLTLGGGPVQVAATRLLRGERHRLVLSWYWVDGRFTASALGVKLLQAKARFLDKHPEAAFVAVAADYLDKPAEAVATISNFLAHAEPLGPALRRAAR